MNALFNLIFWLVVLTLIVFGVYFICVGFGFSMHEVATCEPVENCAGKQVPFTLGDMIKGIVMVLLAGLFIWMKFNPNK